MLFYTYKTPTDSIKATYSGRYLYIHLKGWADYHEVLEQAFPTSDLTPWSGSNHEKPSTVKCILAHEYTHKKILSHSILGHILIGYAYSIRTAYLLRNKTTHIEDYYRKRTIYLMETMAYHEELAQTLDTAIDKAEQSIDEVFDQAMTAHYQAAIKAADQKVLEKYKRHNLHLPLIPCILHRLVGQWIQDKIIIKCSHYAEDGYIDSSFGDHEFLNGLHAQSKQNASPTWKAKIINSVLIQRIDLPLSLKADYYKLIEWYRLSQKAQFETLKAVYQISFQSFWNRYMVPNVFFILKWAGVPLSEYSDIIEFCEDVLLINDDEKFWERWNDRTCTWKNKEYFTRFFEFIYALGS